MAKCGRTVETKMIKIIEAPEKYENDCGDLVCDFDGGKVGKYLSQPLKENKGWQILPLGVLDPNPFIALKRLDIDPENIVSKYVCPYTNYEHYSVMPIAVFSQNLKKNYFDILAAKRLWNIDYVLDHAWHKKMHGDALLAIADIAKMLLGSGYTHGTMINDGSRSMKVLMAHLENGDLLYNWAWEWYNK
jgi:hypothetical protein